MKYGIDQYSFLLLYRSEGDASEQMIAHDESEYNNGYEKYKRPCGDLSPFDPR